jgi:hypothetical protein
MAAESVVEREAAGVCRDVKAKAFGDFTGIERIFQLTPGQENA